MDSLDKLYRKLNRKFDLLIGDETEEELLANFTREKKMLKELNVNRETFLDENNKLILDPIIIKLSDNEILYNNFIKPYIDISYKDFLKQIKEIPYEEIKEYLINNMEFTSCNNMIERIWIEQYIENNINKKICPTPFANKTKTQYFKLFCDSILKKKAHDYNIRIKSNPVSLGEFLTKYKEKDIKFKVSKASEYLQCSGTCDFENTISMYTTSLKLGNLLNHEQADYLFLQSAYHELAHAKITNKAGIQYPFLDKNLYKQFKSYLFLMDDKDYYIKFHDFFENEISAELDGYKNLINDLEEYNYKDLAYIKVHLGHEISKNKLNRFTKMYDDIDNEFDELIKNNLVYLKRNTWLKYEYDKNGNRKDILDLLVSKLKYEASLNNAIRTEENLDNSRNNKTLNYYKKHKTSGEIDELFYEMIYRKINEYTFDEFKEIIKDYSGLANIEINNTFNYIKRKYEMELNIIAEEYNFSNEIKLSKLYVAKKYAVLEKYRSIFYQREKEKVLKRG